MSSIAEYPIIKKARLDSSPAKNIHDNIEKLLPKITYITSVICTLNKRSFDEQFTHKDPLVFHYYYGRFIDLKNTVFGSPNPSIPDLMEDLKEELNQLDSQWDYEIVHTSSPSGNCDLSVKLFRRLHEPIRAIFYENVPHIDESIIPYQGTRITGYHPTQKNYAKILFES